MITLATGTRDDIRVAAEFLRAKYQETYDDATEELDPYEDRVCHNLLAGGTLFLDNDLGLAMLSSGFNPLRGNRRENNLDGVYIIPEKRKSLAGGRFMHDIFALIHGDLTVSAVYMRAGDEISKKRFKIVRNVYEYKGDGDELALHQS